ncbi:dynactin subunit 3-like [Brevipalpus obovatus]|uniref:dynactin subunit 3-like n=1 Tax=Brevipalpus obovatus TaxID=246614 RepID=UPI003D9FA8C7
MKVKDDDLNESVERLERRVCFLERLVMGSRYRVPPESNLVDPLLEVISKLRTLTGGREKFDILSVKLQELGPYIEKMDQFNEDCDPDLVRWELILSQEDNLRKKSALLDIILEHRRIVDSEVLKDLDPFKAKLEKLHTIAVKQEQQANQLSKETLNLIENYNQLLTKIKSRLVAWDKKLLLIEAHKDERKVGEIIPDFD